MFYTVKPGKINAKKGRRQKSPGVEEGAIEQSAVEVVAHEVGAHHGAFAVFWGGDGFGDNQVGSVPNIQ